RRTGPESPPEAQPMRGGNDGSTGLSPLHPVDCEGGARGRLFAPFPPTTTHSAARSDLTLPHRPSPRIGREPRASRLRGDPRR
ncbi:MAG: hypothetical protein ACREQ5_35385, partial [Candidatus Dormibacteria bacterium]